VFYLQIGWFLDCEHCLDRRDGRAFNAILPAN